MGFSTSLSNDINILPTRLMESLTSDEITSDNYYFYDMGFEGSSEVRIKSTYSGAFTLQTRDNTGYAYLRIRDPNGNGSVTIYGSYKSLMFYKSSGTWYYQTDKGTLRPFTNNTDIKLFGNVPAEANFKTGSSDWVVGGGTNEVTARDWNFGYYSSASNGLRHQTWWTTDRKLIDGAKYTFSVCSTGLDGDDSSHSPYPGLAVRYGTFYQMIGTASGGSGWNGFQGGNFSVIGRGPLTTMHISLNGHYYSSGAIFNDSTSSGVPSLSTPWGGGIYVNVIVEFP